MVLTAEGAATHNQREFLLDLSEVFPLLRIGVGRGVGWLLNGGISLARHTFRCQRPLPA